MDATFYRIPSEKTVRGWYEQTPEDFVFACKVPQSITHESCLVDCDDQLRGFVNVMSGLKQKLGPMLLQFPTSTKRSFPSPRDSWNGCGRFCRRCRRNFNSRSRYATRPGSERSYSTCCTITRSHSR